MRSAVRALAIGLIALSNAGCAAIGNLVSAADEALYEAVPLHPVTGQPMLSMVSEEREVGAAQAAWKQIESNAQRDGIPVDPAGPRLQQLQRVFRNLVAVSHRQHLPWTVHLLRHPMPNAVTPGGGMVIFFEGIFTDYPGGKGFLAPRDDEIAAVLAHEIAHVTLMHMTERQTHQLFTSRHQKDPYYSAAYTTNDEAEADRLSVLYMALAGYDPMAAPRVWQEAHRRSGSDPGNFLYSHPLHNDRIRLTHEAAAHVQTYYRPRVRNSEWATLLADNPLFPRAAATERSPGAGILKAVGAAGEALQRHEQSKQEADAREAAALRSPAAQASLVRILETRRDDQGRDLIWMHFENASQYDVRAIGVTVTYFSRKQAIGKDPNCGGEASVPAGQNVWLSCEYKRVRGADGVGVEITGVQFR